ncbi:MAG: UDP-N-acetylmuramoyl-L-alanyl-D-glutamate--2,6-diaminopimelate ligase [Armatimonadota bacterium]
MTELGELAKAVPGSRLSSPDAARLQVRGVAYDSRAVQPGDLFFCVRGLKTDGRRFLPAAVERGALAAVVDAEVENPSVPLLQVPDVRKAMGPVSAELYGHPARHLALVGITGTNGKTTTSYLVEAIARAAGRPTGVLGTIGARRGDEPLEMEHTTPEAPDLQSLLARMREGVERRVVAMEVSSHALDQGRSLGCEFDVAAFTNLTQDHLDYHPSMEDYFQAKARLFTEYPRASEKAFTAVVNVDDEYGRRLARMAEGRVLTYGVREPADLRAGEIRASVTGLEYTLTTPEGVFPVRLRIGGLFNVYNSLAAAGAARALGIDWQTITAALSEAPGVPGRFESVSAGQDFGVIVDYAHTPDGLENVLRAARALEPRRVLTVFGCGGDRDRGKRPIMARIAAELSDVVVVTSDNPRSEDPDAIIREILTGIPAGAGTWVETEPDRARAIERAVSAAETGDVVVIAGKGHEDYQIFADRTIHFDDREQARKALNARLSS